MVNLLIIRELDREQVFVVKDVLVKILLVDVVRRGTTLACRDLHG